MFKSNKTVHKFSSLKSQAKSKKLGLVEIEEINGFTPGFEIQAWSEGYSDGNNTSTGNDWVIPNCSDDAEYIHTEIVDIELYFDHAWTYDEDTEWRIYDQNSVCLVSGNRPGNVIGVPLPLGEKCQFSCMGKYHTAHYFEKFTVERDTKIIIPERKELNHYNSLGRIYCNQ